MDPIDEHVAGCITVRPRALCAPAMHGWRTSGYPTWSISQPAVRQQWRAASSAAPAVLPLCSLSPLPARQATPQHPHPSLEMHFPTFPGLYHTCHQGSIPVTSCNMETRMGLGMGTCVVPLRSLAPAGEPAGPYLQFSVGIALGAWEGLQQ